MIKKILFLLFIICTSNIHSQNSTLSEKSSVSILTCGSGEELYTTFGHTAIRVKDSINNLDVVYNYGAFDFREGNFYAKFVKGDLNYFINASSYDDFISEYQLENREVVEQTLNFSLIEKQQIFDKLNASLFSDERYYNYKFIDKNCTTMVVEKINAIKGKELIKKTDAISISYRTVLYPYFENHFWYKLGINIIFGAKVDENATKLFLPIELLHSLNKSKNLGQPLVLKQETIVKGIATQLMFSFFNSIYVVILVLFLIALSNNRTVFFSYLFLLGLLGIFFSLVGFYSFHKELLWNYNVLLFNPLYVILPFLKNSKFRRNLIYILGFLHLLYVVILLNKSHFVLMIPFILVTLYILYRLKPNTTTPI
ncbi:MAG: DUF4105 domain-containing protein [Flavobacterium sp.]|nr:DUF4105 domain-containing protein [Flavobacterium sp.]